MSDAVICQRHASGDLSRVVPEDLCECTGECELEERVEVRFDEGAHRSGVDSVRSGKQVITPTEQYEAHDGGILDSAQSLDNRLEDLAAEINDLEIELEPFLIDDDEATATEGVSPATDQSDLRQQLRMAVGHVEMMTARLRALKDRVDL